MRLKLADVPIPFGVTKKFLARYDEVFVGKEEEISDFEDEIKYPPIEYANDFYWNEMSYNRFTESSLSYDYDYYRDGDWNNSEVESADKKTAIVLCSKTKYESVKR